MVALQINFMCHNKAFSSIKQALDPNKNIEYAAKNLRTKYDRCRSWNLAISKYHSDLKVTESRALLNIILYYNNQ